MHENGISEGGVLWNHSGVGLVSGGGAGVATIQWFDAPRSACHSGRDDPLPRLTLGRLFGHTTLDPTDDWSFWTVQEFADATGDELEWKTVIAEINPNW